MSNHHHTHNHHHSESNIKVAFFLNLFFSLVELVGGLFTNSVAILSDAVHDLGDSFTLGISWYFEKASKKDRDSKFSYGYKRLTVLGAFISSFVLLLGSVFIIVETIPRLIDPVTPDTQGMMLLAGLGLLVNGFAAYRLSKGHSLNEKAVFVHLLEDVLGWAATLIGAIVIHFTDFSIIDPLLSILISTFILYNVYKNLKEGIQIILQATPATIDIEEIHQTLRQLPGVKDFHDCHVWSLDGRENVLSIHLITSEPHSMKELESIKTEAKRKLTEVGISHATIEFETEDENCDPC